MALIDKASLLMVPSTYEAGTLYNVLPSGNRAPDSTDQNSGYDQTRADFTFDRGTDHGATRIGSDGLIKKYRENLITQSNNFSDSDWITSNTSVTSGQVDKDGGTSAWLLEKGATSYSSIYQPVTISGVYTFSVYAKAGTASIMTLRDGINQRALFDLSDGSIDSTAGSPVDAEIELISTGWYRCSITMTTSNPNLQIYVGWSDSTAGNIYIQNAQLEASMVATDYLDSGATTAKAGVLIDLPRINYDANGENGSLLLEPQRTNLLPHSEYFGVWGKVSATITANTTISPDGYQNANTFTTSGSGARIFQTLSLGAGTYTASLYVKKLSGSGNMRFFGIVDGGGVTQSFTPTDEWQRFTGNFTASTGITEIQLRENGFTGTLAIYGFQLEAGSYPTSYIPNHGESGGVTRAADFGSDDDITASPIEFGANDDFTLFYEGSFNDLSSTSNMIMGGGRQQLGSSYKNYWWVQNATNMRITGEGEVKLATTTMSLSDNTNHKLLVKRNGSIVDFFVDGVKLTTTQNNPNTAFTFRSLGWAYTNSVYKVSGNLKKAIIFNEALTDAECITLTTL